MWDGCDGGGKGWFHVFSWDAPATLPDSNRSFASVLRELEALTEGCVTLSARLDEWESRNEKEAGGAAGELESLQRYLTSEVKRIDALRDSHEVGSRKLEKLCGDLEHLQQQQTSLTKTLERQEQEGKEIRNEIGYCGAQNTQLEETVHRLKADQRAFKSTISNEICQLHEGLSAINKSHLETRLNKLEVSAETYSQQTQSLSYLQCDVDNLRKNFMDLTVTVAKDGERTAGLQNAMKPVKEDFQSIQSDIRGLQKQFADHIRSNATKLKEVFDSSQSACSKAYSVDEEQKQQRLDMNTLKNTVLELQRSASNNSMERSAHFEMISQCMQKIKSLSKNVQHVQAKLKHSSVSAAHSPPSSSSSCSSSHSVSTSHSFSNYGVPLAPSPNSNIVSFQPAGHGPASDPTGANVAMRVPSSPFCAVSHPSTITLTDYRQGSSQMHLVQTLSPAAIPGPVGPSTFTWLVDASQRPSCEQSIPVNRKRPTSSEEDKGHSPIAVGSPHSTGSNAKGSTNSNSNSGTTSNNISDSTVTRSNNKSTTTTTSNSISNNIQSSSKPNSSRNSTSSSRASRSSPDVILSARSNSSRNTTPNGRNNRSMSFGIFEDQKKDNIIAKRTLSGTPPFINHSLSASPSDAIKDSPYNFQDYDDKDKAAAAFLQFEKPPAITPIVPMQFMSPSDMSRGVSDAVTCAASDFLNLESSISSICPLKRMGSSTASTSGSDIEEIANFIRSNSTVMSVDGTNESISPKSDHDEKLRGQLPVF